MTVEDWLRLLALVGAGIVIYTLLITMIRHDRAMARRQAARRNKP